MTKPKDPLDKVRRPGTGLRQLTSITTPTLNSKASNHLIDDISYSKDYIVCTCAWKGPVNTYQLHRKIEEPDRRK